MTFTHNPTVLSYFRIRSPTEYSLVNVYLWKITMKTHGHFDWAMFYSKQKQSLPEGDTKYPNKPPSSYGSFLIYLIYTWFSMIFPLKMVIFHDFPIENGDSPWFFGQALATELRQCQPRADAMVATRGASFVSLYPNGWASLVSGYTCHGNRSSIKNGIKM